MCVKRPSHEGCASDLRVIFSTGTQHSRPDRSTTVTTSPSTSLRVCDKPTSGWATLRSFSRRVPTQWARSIGKRGHSPAVVDLRLSHASRPPWFSQGGPPRAQAIETRVAHLELAQGVGAEHGKAWVAPKELRNWGWISPSHEYFSERASSPAEASENPVPAGPPFCQRSTRCFSLAAETCCSTICLLCRLEAEVEETA